MEEYTQEVPATVGDGRKHPRGLNFLFFTEMWERFGYYLMIGILFLYMKDTAGGLGWDTEHASDVFGTFIALVYLTPFIGGLLADRLLGYRRSIIIGCFIMGLGYLAMAVPDLSQYYYGKLIFAKESSFFMALGLIIIGTGFFKANISTLLGNLYSQPQYRSKKDSGYSIFYMGINIGAFVCNFFAAYLRNTFSWGAAFAAAGAGMFIALFIFASGNRHYKEVDVRKPKQPEDMSLGKMLGLILGPAAVGAVIGGWLIEPEIFGSKTTDAFIFACLPIIGFFLDLYRRSSAKDKQPIGALLAVMGVVIVFWAIFKQNGTALTEWAQKYTDREVPAVVAKPIERLGFMQTVDLEIKEVPDYDGQFRTKTVDKKVVTKMGVDPYLNNLPKEEWPTQDKPLYLINTELFQSVNPFFIVILTPLVLGFFTWLRRRKKEPSTPAKLNLGLLISALSSVVMIGAVYAAHNGLEKSSMWWLIGTYGVITVGELFLSPMGLSLVSKLSPVRIAGLMMGAWSLSTSIGNKLSGVLASMWDTYENKEFFFMVNIALLFVAALSIYMMLPWLRAVVDQNTKENA